MNRLFAVLTVFLMAFSISCKAQTSEQKEVRKTILAFAKAGDKQDASKLEQLLDANYRIVMNQLFGSKEVMVMPRAAYLDKIKKGEFGGDKREVVVKEILMNGNTASARVSYKGQKSSFESIVVLVKDASASWKLVSEIPVM